MCWSSVAPSCNCAPSWRWPSRLSTRLPLDGAYRQFLEQFTAAVCATLSRLQSDRALAESSRIKDEFLAMLGHELRNPLAPIVTALAHSCATPTPCMSRR
jgi:signal transduction histidine kinase